IDLIYAIVTYCILVFATITVLVNVLLIVIIYRGKTMNYTRNFFYTIYMVGFGIDIVAMMGSNLGSLFPSRGWFLNFYLSSTFPGRIWSSGAVRTLAIAFQLGVGIVLGGFAGAGDVYWRQEKGGGWYILILYCAAYAYAFVMQSNSKVCEISLVDLRIFYICYFIINDLYGGLPAYLLIIFSRSVRKDFLSLIRF
ncbi:hypothetical protein PFISCL1PPCAC_14120, partial [Pristionchus fissidentatus]